MIVKTAIQCLTLQLNATCFSEKQQKPSLWFEQTGFKEPMI